MQLSTKSTQISEKSLQVSAADLIAHNKLVIFDLDGTLAESKAPLDAEMAGLLGELLIHRKVAVISGASFGQFQTQFLAHLKKYYVDEKKDAKKMAAAFANLSILSTSGSSFYKYDPASVGAGSDVQEKSDGLETDGWVLVYENNFTAEEKRQVKDALATITPDIRVEKTYGEQLEDRNSQMTFSALGQQAPIEAKRTWDPDHKIREALVARLRPMLPDFELNIGGMTTIDITKKGIDKEYGINALVDHFSITKSEVVYVGDAIFPGGNDYAAVLAGVPIHPVTDVSDTKKFIRELFQGIMKAQK